MTQLYRWPAEPDGACDRLAAMPSRSLHPLVLIVVLLVSVSACQAVAELPAQLGTGTGPLVTLVTSGGRCATGTCEARATIDASGRLVHIDGSSDVVPPERMVRIVQAIAATDWQAVLATPFTGDCPTAFDGQERTWTIRTPGGAVVVADCTVAVDYDSPPFQLFVDEIFVLGG